MLINNPPHTQWPCTLERWVILAPQLIITPYLTDYMFEYPVYIHFQLKKKNVHSFLLYVKSNLISGCCRPLSWHPEPPKFDLSMSDLFHFLVPNLSYCPADWLLPFLLESFNLYYLSETNVGYTGRNTHFWLK